MSDHDFAKLAKKEKNARQRIRFLAFAHIVDGKIFSEAARIVKVFPRTIMTWISKFRKSGINGLKEQSILIIDIEPVLYPFLISKKQ